jgi:hypothetical protein
MLSGFAVDCVYTSDKARMVVRNKREREHIVRMEKPSTHTFGVWNQSLVREQRLKRESPGDAQHPVLQKYLAVALPFPRPIAEP